MWRGPQKLPDAKDTALEGHLFKQRHNADQHLKFILLKGTFRKHAEPLEHCWSFYAHSYF